jgi:hypothetical protein
MEIRRAERNDADDDDSFEEGKDEEDAKPPPLFRIRGLVTLFPAIGMRN